MTRDPQPDDAVVELSGWFACVFDGIEAMNRDFTALIEQVSTPDDGVARLAESGRAALRGRVGRFLGEHRSTDGAGLVFARPADATSPSAIEWWVRGSGGDIDRYRFGTDPAAAGFYEYERLEWFVRAYRDGRPCIAGPYIDYLGVDQYIVTLTVQAVAHGRPIGAAGADIRVSDLERALMPIMRRVPGAAAVLNTHDAVLVGNSSRLLTGDRIAEIPDGFRLTPLPGSHDLLRLLHR
ncbi:cache domain-containing protein [Pseudonocardia nematodicida]|uniref:Cache domain-containing protein n=1 Tax=Pseudonocardia nematodicida TaxID=1206997 RepID=A0ABV1K7N2_9PSEU